MLATLQACLLNLPDLIPDEPSSLHVATQLSQRVRRYWLVLGRAQIFKAPGGLLLRILAYRNLRRERLANIESCYAEPCQPSAQTKSSLGMCRARTCNMPELPKHLILVVVEGNVGVFLESSLAFAAENPDRDSNKCGDEDQQVDSCTHDRLPHLISFRRE